MSCSSKNMKQNKIMFRYILRSARQNLLISSFNQKKGITIECQQTNISTYTLSGVNSGIIPVNHQILALLHPCTLGNVAAKIQLLKKNHIQVLISI